MNKPNIIGGTSMVDTAKDITCECGNDIFAQGVKLKKVSAIMSPTGKEQLGMQPVLYCTKCNKVYEEKENE